MRLDPGLIGLFVLAALAVGVLLAVMPAGASQTGDTYSDFSGDWVVTQPTKVIDETLFVDGDIQVNSTLELWNATIYMVVGSNNQYKVNVSTTGNLKANHTHITSAASWIHYGFTVHGMMTLKKVTVEEMYNGVRVLTDKQVLIQDSRLHRGYRGGLYLKDADGTSVKNVSVQADSIREYAEWSADINSYYETRYAIIGSGGAVHVKGGKPTLEDLTVSGNGTLYVTAHLGKTDYYGRGYFDMLFGLVCIDSDEFDETPTVHGRDSKPNFDVHWHFYNNYTYSYGRIYTYSVGRVSVINVLNYDDIELKGATMNDNLKTGSVSARYTRHDSFWGTYTYTRTDKPMYYGAGINKRYTTIGPHTWKVTLDGMTKEDEAIMAVSVTPDFTGTGTPTFRSIVVIDDITLNKGSNFFVVYAGARNPGMKVMRTYMRVSNCTFTNTSGELFYSSFSPGPGANINNHNVDLYQTAILENSLVRWADGRSKGLIYEPYWRFEFNNFYDTHWIFRGNTFMDTEGGYLFYMRGSYEITSGFERVTFEDNLFHNVTETGYDRLFYIYYKERITFNNNTFVDVQYYYYSYIYSQGGSSNGKKPDLFIISNNTFRNSFSTYGSSSYGFFYIRWGGDLIVSDNYITNLDNNCLIRFEPNNDYSGYCNFWFTGNEWTNCTAYMLYYQFYAWWWWGYDFSVTLYIEGNTAWDSGGDIIQFSDSDAQRADWEYVTYFRNNTISDFDGRIYRNWGEQIITGNTFTDCTGYVIETVYIDEVAPVLRGNTISNCQDVYYMSAVDKGALKVSMAVSDLYVDCTGNAFYFQNIDVTMTNVTITDNASVGITVDDSTADALKSSIPIGSGQVIGEGEINVWFQFELSSEWSNKANPGQSSGEPVVDGLVVLFGSKGSYFTSMYTDDEGHVKPFLIPQWTLKGALMTAWTPYSYTVAKAGVSTQGTFDLNKDLSGNDALFVLLSDPHIPVIRITSPLEGDVFSTDELVLRGFSTEIGSGLRNISVAIGEGAYELVEFDENGDFAHTFTELPEGIDITMRARVYDYALNMNETYIAVTVDRTPPKLIIQEPEEGAIYNVAKITITGTYEEGSTITINGLERDSTDGTLSENYTLSEGANTILVVATDLAGNQNMTARNVSLDRFPPTLTVLAPRDGLIIKVTNTTVEGDVELGSQLLISVFRTSTDTIEEAVTIRPDGTFSHKVDLDEGENRIEVMAYDDAENEAKVTRYVHVDTTAPFCEITSPEDGEMTNENTIRVLGTSDVEGVTLYLNGKQIFNDGTVERFVNLNEGPNDIVLRAVDRIGNENNQRVTVILDTEPPTIEMLSPRRDHIMTNEDTINVSGKVVGASMVTMNGLQVDLVPVDGGHTFETTASFAEGDGEYEVTVLAFDAAGNVAGRSFMVDYSTRKPMVLITFQPPSTSIGSESSNLYISGATDPGIEEVTVTHQVGGETSETTVPVAEDGTFSVVQNMLEGDNTFTVSLVDAHGNTNSSAAHTVSYTYVEPPSKKKVEEPLDLGAISLWILFIAVALFLTAVFVTRSLRQDRD